MRLLLLVYNLLFPAVLLALLPAAFLRMRKRGNYAHKFGQRLGWFSKRTKSVLRRDCGSWIWIHAVSVGEVLIAQKFIRELRAKTDLPVLLSTTTSTGFSLAQQGKDARTEVIYHPLDFLPTVLRVVHLVRPAALVLVEAEIWPNLTTVVKRTGSPVLLINARISPRSHRRYRSMRSLVSPLFRQLDAVGVQTPEDLGRFVSIGFLPDQLRLVGSIKFDPSGSHLPDPQDCRKVLRACGIGPSARILLGASTHEGEEMLLADAVRELRRDFPDLRLVLVPRHAERAREIDACLSDKGFPVIRRTDVSLDAKAPAPDSASEEPPVLLVDTTGELRQWTQLASAVFVGKSLAAHGGQNPAEAILAGKPLILGPNMENFADLVSAILAVNGARQITKPDDLPAAIRGVFSSPEDAGKMAASAAKALEFHRGATEKSVALLHTLPRLQAQ